ncbi:Protein CBG20530 [Caenorhabditis briggsae]|uniref:Protein CBG20530 n=1 Tax=Caenorhabditis briggsae TaxID=6238 RepID=A8XY06_CAEBR|nr:Protein CBG20530 [Caenorhabditis briggsae]CAP37525.2 Protein CBG20530 [Caenorhabditis briggsae]
MKRIKTSESGCPKAKKIAKNEEEVKKDREPQVEDVRIAFKDEIKKYKKLKLENGRKYDVQKVLGEGVFGIVFEVFDEKKRKLAAKMMKKTDEPPDIWKIELHVQAEAYQRPDTLGSTFPIPQIRDIGRQMVSALAHLDILGIYHLDIKPENVYFVENGAFDIRYLRNRHLAIEMKDTKIQIGDFGCSKFHKEFESDVKPTVVQTQNYRAPEVFIGLPYSTKSDVWSFGALMAEMYTGMLLFYGTDDESSEATQFEMMQRVVGQFVNRAMFRKALLHGSDHVRKDNGILQRTAKKFEPTVPLHMNLKKFDFEAIPLFEMLKYVLILDPELRPSFEDVANHKFFALN